ncbi:MAG: hypothetical protein ACPGJS_21905 [Flammeovirgaceae bacterium]
MKKILICLLAISLFSCNKEELEQLKMENGQLKAALGESNEFSEELNTKMNTIDVLLDSIEIAEESLTLSLAEGTNYDDYSERLRAVKDYIENSKAEVAKLEKNLSKALSKNSFFMRQIKKLKQDISDREANIIKLSEQVEEFREENAALVKTVDLQKGEILAQERMIKDKKRELALLEARVDQMKKDAKKAEADAYFAQAEASEQLAQKTKLAPKKKKEHLQDAYDLFKKSFEAGRTDAYKRMEMIEEKLK